MQRPEWDAYFMDLAARAALRSTCNRAMVGCLIVAPDHSVLATGYNGSLAGEPHCTDAGHIMRNGHCVRSVHAEANAIAQAARRGTAVDHATAYLTHAPCINCVKLLLSAGIVRVVYVRAYDDGDNMTYLAAHADRVLVQQMEIAE